VSLPCRRKIAVIVLGDGTTVPPSRRITLAILRPPQALLLFARMRKTSASTISLVRDGLRSGRRD